MEVVNGGRRHTYPFFWLIVNISYCINYHDINTKKQEKETERQREEMRERRRERERQTHSHDYITIPTPGAWLLGRLVVGWFPPCWNTHRYGYSMYLLPKGRQQHYLLRHTYCILLSQLEGMISATQ
jgi:hypothetical protein